MTAPRMRAVSRLDTAVATCRACPRLVAWCEEVAQVKRRAFWDCGYWARPVPGFRPPNAPLAIIGLATAAHGGNRTERIFTGGPSGDVLYPALHAEGLASPRHLPPWLARELQLLHPTLRAIVVLGGFAWQALLPVLHDAGWQLPRPRPAFGHGAHVLLRDARGDRQIHLLGRYPPQSAQHLHRQADSHHAPRRPTPWRRHGQLARSAEPELTTR